MANTYQLIASNTLTSSAASVTFSSIPATYTDLVLRMSTRCDYSNTISRLAIELNSDASSIYSNTRLQGSGSAATSGRSSNATYYWLDYSNAATSSTNTFATSEIYIPSYLVSQNKPINGFIAQENNLAEAYMSASAGLYRSTSAISTIKLTDANAANFVSGSSFFLYGIKNS